MCGLLVAVVKARQLAAPRAKVMIQRATYINSKPPKHSVGPMVSSERHVQLAGIFNVLKYST